MALTKEEKEAAAAKKAAEESTAKDAKVIADLQATVKAQAEQSDKLMKGMQALAGVVKGQKDSVEKLAESFESSTKVKPASSSSSSNSDTDVESLSRKEFLNDVIIPQFGSILDEKLKGMTDRLDSVHSDFETKSVKDEVATLRGNRPDFDSWKEEVAGELRKNPHLSVEDAYLLARTRDPEKSSKIDKEAEDAKVKAKEDEERSSSTKGSFGGMRPSGGGEIEERDDMNIEEAAESAWKEVEDALGGKAGMDQSLGMEPST